MTMERVQLREFGDAELIFNDQETRSILEFFFRADSGQLASALVTRELRSLAQSLLVAAVDTTYAMGWIELTFRWVANPGPGMKKALHKLARNAARFWFKHLGDKSLSDAKIYERVRDQLARSFRSPLLILLQAHGRPTSAPLIAFVDCHPAAQSERAWG